MQSRQQQPWGFMVRPVGGGATKIIIIIMTICVIAMVVDNGMAAAFRPPPIYDELGCSPTLAWFFGGNTIRSNGGINSFYFDPAGLASDNNFARYREAELKHGRVAMLAVTETMIAPIYQQLRHAILNQEQQQQHHQEQSSSVSVWLNAHKWFPPMRQSPDEGVWHHLQSSLVVWNQVMPVILTCLVLETAIFIQRDIRDMPGDYGCGYFGIRNKGLHEASLIQELEHGRLAMIAFVSQLILEVAIAHGKPWHIQWIEAFKEWVQSL